MEFNELNLAEMDKDLTAEERAEWQAIYASYRSGSVMRGEAAGVDYHEFEFVPEGKKRAVKQKLRCMIIISYRIKVIIPETEMFLISVPEGGYILHSMCGAKLDYVITYVDRENNFAVASRKLALEKMQKASNRRNISDRIIDADVVSVGRNVCLLNYGGYDVLLRQRDINYTMVSDIREIVHTGEVRKAKVKEFVPEEGILKLSIKETMPHPFDGVETRHPVGSTRVATVVGKYGGGVFCRLSDNAPDVLCSYDTMHYDGDFQLGDRVEILIKRLNYEKKLIYGKMLRKMR